MTSNVTYMPRHSGKKTNIEWRSSLREDEWVRRDTPPFEEPKMVRGMYPSLMGYSGEVHVMTLYTSNTSIMDGDFYGDTVFTVVLFLPETSTIEGDPGDSQEEVMKLAQAEFQDWLERMGLREKSDV